MRCQWTPYCETGFARLHIDHIAPSLARVKSLSGSPLSDLFQVESSDEVTSQPAVWQAKSILVLNPQSCFSSCSLTLLIVLYTSSVFIPPCCPSTSHSCNKCKIDFLIACHSTFHPLWKNQTFLVTWLHREDLFISLAPLSKAVGIPRVCLRWRDCSCARLSR